MSYNTNFKDEFATIDLLLNSNTTTGRNDAFILVYTKLDKQIRKLFTYLVFQSGGFFSPFEIIEIIAADGNLYTEHFIKGFDALCKVSFANILAGDYDKFEADRERIKDYRNKMLHGQLTGKSLDAKQLADEVKLIGKWMLLIAEKMSKKIGYDGLGRNSFRYAESEKDFSNMFTGRVNNNAELKELIEKTKQQIEKERKKKNKAKAIIVANNVR